jgi:hypothetical protein
VASWLAAENPSAFRAVLLENTFLSIPALAPCLLPLIGSVIGHGNKPLNWIIKSPWKGYADIACTAEDHLYTAHVMALADKTHEGSRRSQGGVCGEDPIARAVPVRGC